MARRTRLVQRQTEVPPTEVQRREVSPEVLALALELANGDKRRLVIQDDGSVVVVNNPKGQVPGS